MVLLKYLDGYLVRMYTSYIYKYISTFISPKRTCGNDFHFHVISPAFRSPAVSFPSTPEKYHIDYDHFQSNPI